MIQQRNYYGCAPCPSTPECQSIIRRHETISENTENQSVNNQSCLKLLEGRSDIPKKKKDKKSRTRYSTES